MKTRRTKAETEADLILRAAQRARPRSEFMAWLLAQAQTQQGCSEAQLAAQLGLAPGQLPRLALYLRPRPDHFSEDVAAIAAQVSCEPLALAGLVHRVTLDEPSHG